MFLSKNFKSFISVDRFCKNQLYQWECY